MTDTRSPSAEAMEAARVYLNSIEGTFNPETHTASHFDDFAEQRAAEARRSEIPRDTHEHAHTVLVDVLRDFDTYSTRYRLLDSELVIAWALHKAKAEARRAAIEEAAQVCDLENKDNPDRIKAWEARQLGQRIRALADRVKP